MKSPFCLAHLPRVEGVHKSSEMAAFAFSAPTHIGAFLF